MDFDDLLCLPQALLETSHLLLELLLLSDQRILALRTPASPGQPLHSAGAILPAPTHQMGGVEPFPAQEGTDLPGLCAGVRLRNVSTVLRHFPLGFSELAGRLHWGVASAPRPHVCVSVPRSRWYQLA